jgi:hypothetical protein
LFDRALLCNGASSFGKDQVWSWSGTCNYWDAKRESLHDGEAERFILRWVDQEGGARHRCGEVIVSYAPCDSYLPL